MAKLRRGLRAAGLDDHGVDPDATVVDADELEDVHSPVSGSTSTVVTYTSNGQVMFGGS